MKSQIANSFEEAKALCKQLDDKDLEHTMQQQSERFFVYWAQVEDTSVSRADFTLIDEAVGDAITGQIDVKHNMGLSLSFEGYGDCCSDDSSGSPVYIEKYDGKVFVRVYGNINSEEPTHNIDLSGAALSNRVLEIA